MKQNRTYFVTLLVTLLFLTNSSYGQVNTPAGATWPFGSRIQQFANPYPYGIIPTNLPTGAYTPGSNLYGKSQDAYLAYVEWKACYAYNCGTGTPVSHWRIRFDDARLTVSEGIGYGMLLAAYAADKTLFDGLWAYYRGRTNANGFMNWRINDGSATGCTTTATGTNGAADSEMDVAMALIVARCQWPAATTPYNYQTEANYIISRIRQFEITPASCGALPLYLTSSGDGFQSGCNNCFNPSYQSPGYTRLWQPFDGAAPANFWTTNVPNASYTHLNANRNTTTGLVSNWAAGNGTMNTCNAPAFADHGYDAIRNPWRMAVDYIWHGTSDARTNFTQPISTWIYTKTTNLTVPNNLRGPVDLNGNNNGRTVGIPEALFTSMWGAATLGVTNVGNNQATLDFMFNRVKAVKQGNFGTDCTSSTQTFYFGNTLRVISLFMMTGNFWKPCPPRCAAPNFTADSVSTCGPNSVLLTSGLAGPAGNRTFQWFKNNVSLGAATTTANTLTVNATTPAPFGPGWFKVKVDTTGGCTQSDSIYVSSTAVKPNLGANVTLCNAASTTLNSGLYLSAGYSFTWEYTSSYLYANLAAIPGETNATLANVRSAGLYKVTATKAGCTSLWDTIRVYSKIVTPVDACRTTAPGSVTLSVTGPNLGPASQYDWYSAITGGSPLTTGAPNPAAGTTTWTTPSLAAGTYTYYIQDKSRVYGSVGKPEPSSPYPGDCNTAAPDPFSLNPDGTTAGWGVDAGNVYSQDWTVVTPINIDSVTVWMCLYNTTLPNVTFALTTNTGAAIGAYPDVVRTGVRMTPAGTTFGGPPYDGHFVGVRYYVGFNNVPAANYRLKVTAAAPALNLLLEQGTATVSYNYYDNIDGNTAYIRSSYGYTTTFGARYAHFYDWTISKPNTCNRIPVIAYIGSCPLALPIELVSFEGKAFRSHNQLDWITSSEINSNYFIVERAGKDEIYHPIGQVSASENASEINEYQFIDNAPLKDGGYYRLVQYDSDGKSYRSYAIYLHAYESDKVALFPNPANTQVTIRSLHNSSNFNTVELIDVMGKTVLTVNGESNERVFDISTLQNGIYVVRITFNGTSETIRLVKN